MNGFAHSLVIESNKRRMTVHVGIHPTGIVLRMSVYLLGGGGRIRKPFCLGGCSRVVSESRGGEHQGRSRNLRRTLLARVMKSGERNQAPPDRSVLASSKLF